uniref:Uncharacterized protein n=1 Tax=Pyricularia oryzae (strain P131) TaxID=1143193 RepID=L7JBB7_PYRO1
MEGYGKPWDALVGWNTGLHNSWEGGEVMGRGEGVRGLSYKLLPTGRF